MFKPDWLKPDAVLELQVSTTDDYGNATFTFEIPVLVIDPLPLTELMAIVRPLCDETRPAIKVAIKHLRRPGIREGLVAHLKEKIEADPEAYANDAVLGNVADRLVEILGEPEPLDG